VGRQAKLKKDRRLIRREIRKHWRIYMANIYKWDWRDRVRFAWGVLFARFYLKRLERSERGATKGLRS